MRAPLSMMPLIPAATAMAAGIILSALTDAALIGLAALAAAIIFAALKQNHTAITTCAAAAGALAFGVGAPDEEALPFNRPITLEADIKEVKDGDATRRLKVSPVRYADEEGSYRLSNPADIYLYIPSTEPYTEPGDRIVATTAIERPETRTYFPEETSEQQRMKRSGIAGKAFVKPENIISAEPSPRIMMRLIKLRMSITGIIYRSGMKGDTKRLVNILITGDTSDMNQSTRKSFSGAGMAHVLALSGLHVGIIASLLMIALYPLRLCRMRSAASASAIILLWSYAAVTGLSASVTRATVMASVLLMASMLQRRHSPANALCLAAMLIMAFDPTALFTISFQLSFAAVAGILLFARLLNPTAPRRRIAHRLAGIVSVSLSAMLATGAISAYYFHTFPIYFLPANVAVAPLLPLLISGGATAITIEACGGDPVMLNSVVDRLAQCVTGIANLCNNLPGATLDGLYFSPWLLVGAALATALLAYGLHCRRMAGMTASALCAVATISMGMIQATPERSGVYIIPAAGYTCVAVATPGSVSIISTAGDRQLSEIAAREMPRMRDYMGRRGIDTLMTANRRAEFPGVVYRCPTLHIGNSSVVFADGNRNTKPTDSAPPVYVIICRGYRGTMKEIATQYRPDTIVMSTDLNTKIADRYMNECRQLNMPAYSMRSGRIPDLNALLR
ncbi:ComEC/Rec2 family competence protein [Paramuribaculum intestinale]|uniref:ComEC/Rec2 family competence protein n=1 Tax=Paramuribaculum intestinale TaxID=2094151 RepID=UPI002729E2E4|nr:ComEC/Rec2 family competence protein [Paramuribaculum intestinale]